jgi:hypothetical protein
VTTTTVLDDDLVDVDSAAVIGASSAPKEVLNVVVTGVNDLSANSVVEERLSVAGNDIFVKADA